MPNWSSILNQVRPVVQFFSYVFSLFPVELFYLLFFFPTFILVFAVVRHGRNLR